MLHALSENRRKRGWKQPAKTWSATSQPQSTTGPLHTPATKGNGLKSLLERIKTKGSYTGVAHGPSSDATLPVTSQGFSRLFRTRLQRKENWPRGIRDSRKSARNAISPVSVPRRRNNTASLQPLPNRTPTASRNGTKGPLEKIKSGKRGYTGVAQRANAFHVDGVLDHGPCFQCDRQLPTRELPDQSRMYGHVVGICNGCYPEFMQYLQDIDIADAGVDDDDDDDDDSDDFDDSDDSDVGEDPENSQFNHTRPYSRRSLSSWITVESAAEPDETVPPDITRECKICGESRSGLHFVPATSNCQHDVDYCSECLRSWISSSLDGRGWDSIRCPAPGCGSTLKTEDIQSIADRETFERYTLLSTTATLSSLDSFRWCLRSGCKSGQIHETGADGPIFRCHACGFKVCVIHDIKWHEGETCKQFDSRTKAERKRQESASAQTISRTTKQCPQNSCRAPIEKSHGCDHMTCAKCRYEFCWLCFASYDAVRRKGNSAHNVGCKYHTQR